MISSVIGKKTVPLVWDGDGNRWLLELGSGDSVAIDRILEDHFEGKGNPSEITLYLSNNSSSDFDATVTADGGSVSPTGRQTVKALMGNCLEWTLTLPLGNSGEASFSILPEEPNATSTRGESERVTGIPHDPTIKVNWSTNRG